MEESGLASLGSGLAGAMAGVSFFEMPLVACLGVGCRRDWKKVEMVEVLFIIVKLTFEEVYLPPSGKGIRKKMLMELP